MKSHKPVAPCETVLEKNNIFKVVMPEFSAHARRVSGKRIYIFLTSFLK